MLGPLHFSVIPSVGLWDSHTSFEYAKYLWTYWRRDPIKGTVLPGVFVSARRVVGWEAQLLSALIHDQVHSSSLTPSKLKST
jgi:hypothetical protein